MATGAGSCVTAAPPAGALGTTAPRGAGGAGAGRRSTVGVGRAGSSVRGGAGTTAAGARGGALSVAGVAVAGVAVAAPDGDAAGGVGTTVAPPVGDGDGDGAVFTGASVATVAVGPASPRSLRNIEAATPPATSRRPAGASSAQPRGPTDRRGGST